MKEKLVKIKELIEKLNSASEAYYNTGNTIMSDKEFDTKLAELEALEKELGIVLSNSPTQRVGAPVLTKLDKVTHEFKPMLSLAKVHSAEEIVKFANGKELIAMVKLDGLSVRLTYHYGVLSKAETRGNGIEGSDITLHVKHFENVPLVINNKEASYVVDGEAIITDYDFESINDALPEGTDKFKNSRNLASGTLALLDTSLVKERHLRFIVWDVITGSMERMMEDKLDEAYKLGFETVPYWFPLSQHAVTITEKDINLINEGMFQDAQDCGYPIDGVVWKFNDVKYGESLGQTSHHFCNAVAFKAKQDVYETILRDIEYTMGKTGVLTPVAIFDSVEIDGTEVTRASVHNISMLIDLELAIGDTITVYKANQIIPQIAENITSKEYKKSNFKDYTWKAPVPSVCPICGGKTSIKKENDTMVLVCTNDSCKGKLLGKLSHFVSKNAMNIDGLSESTLERFIDLGWINNFTDIYKLDTYETEMQKLEGFGKKSVSKLLQSIEKSRYTDLAHLLNAIGIPGCGRSTSKDIANYCNGDIDKFFNILSWDAHELESINGIGETLIDSLNKWYKSKDFEVICNLIEYLNVKVSKENENATDSYVDLSGNTYVITGSLEHFSNRDGLKDLIEGLGGRVSGSVSVKTTALINNDVNSTSSKNKKAKELGVPIITEKEFLDSIGY